MQPPISVLSVEHGLALWHALVAEGLLCIVLMVGIAHRTANIGDDYRILLRSYRKKGSGRYNRVSMEMDALTIRPLHRSSSTRIRIRQRCIPRVPEGQAAGCSTVRTIFSPIR